MIEVAVASLREALRANGELAPEGSLDPPRVPLAGTALGVEALPEGAEPAPARWTVNDEPRGRG